MENINFNILAIGRLLWKLCISILTVGIFDGWHIIMNSP